LFLHRYQTLAVACNVEWLGFEPQELVEGQKTDIQADLVNTDGKKQICHIAT